MDDEKGHTRVEKLNTPTELRARWRYLSPERVGKIGEFYLALWRHLDALSDEGRWFTSREIPAPHERTRELLKQFRELESLKLDSRLMSSMQEAMEGTFELADEVISRGMDDVSLTQRIDQMKMSLADLGNKYERLEIGVGKPMTSLVGKPMTSLFDAVLASLKDPSRATQRSDLEGLSFAFEGTGSSTNQIANLIGGFLKPMLREQHAVAGQEGVDSLLQQIKQNADSSDRLRQVLGADRMDQMVGSAEQKTGLDSSVILRLLPVVLPAMIGLLESGRPVSPLARRSGGSDPRMVSQENPILSQFLDSDRDADTDMEDVIRLTSVFLRR